MPEFKKFSCARDGRPIYVDPTDIINIMEEVNDQGEMEDMPRSRKYVSIGFMEAGVASIVGKTAGYAVKESIDEVIQALGDYAYRFFRVTLYPEGRAVCLLREQISSLAPVSKNGQECTGVRMKGGKGALVLETPNDIMAMVRSQ